MCAITISLLQLKRQGSRSCLFEGNDEVSFASWLQGSTYWAIVSLTFQVQGTSRPAPVHRTFSVTRNGPRLMAADNPDTLTLAPRFAEVPWVRTGPAHHQFMSGSLNQVAQSYTLHA